MKPELLSAVLEDKSWLERFSRTEYFNAFREYTQQYGPAYMELVRGQDDAALTALANELLDSVAAAAAKVRIWNRFNVRFNAKQMLLGYLSPMLLGLEEENCRRFAEILRDEWAVRWPKEAYQLATYQKIRAGFRRMVLGLELKDNLRELEDEIVEQEKNQK